MGADSENRHFAPDVITVAGRPVVRGWCFVVGRGQGYRTRPYHRCSPLVEEGPARAAADAARAGEEGRARDLLGREVCAWLDGEGEETRAALWEALRAAGR